MKLPSWLVGGLGRMAARPTDCVVVEARVGLPPFGTEFIEFDYHLREVAPNKSLSNEALQGTW